MPVNTEVGTHTRVARDVSALLRTPTLTADMPEELILWRNAGLSCVLARHEKGSLSSADKARARMHLRKCTIPTKEEAYRWYPDVCTYIQTHYEEVTSEHLLRYFRVDHVHIEPTPTWIGTVKGNVPNTPIWRIAKVIKAKHGISVSSIMGVFNTWDIPLSVGATVLVHATHIVEVLPPEECP